MSPEPVPSPATTCDSPVNSAIEAKVEFTEAAAEVAPVPPPQKIDSFGSFQRQAKPSDAAAKDALLKDLTLLVRRLLSRENISVDPSVALLLNRTCDEVCIEMRELMRHPLVARMGVGDEELIWKAIERVGPDYIKVDRTTGMIKPVMRAQRTTLIIRNMGDASRQQVESFIAEAPCLIEATVKVFAQHGIAVAPSPTAETPARPACDGEKELVKGFAEQTSDQREPSAAAADSSPAGTPAVVAADGVADTIVVCAGSHALSSPDGTEAGTGGKSQFTTASTTEIPGSKVLGPANFGGSSSRGENGEQTPALQRVGPPALASGVVPSMKAPGGMASEVSTPKIAPEEGDAGTKKVLAPLPSTDLDTSCTVGAGADTPATPLAAPLGDSAAEIPSKATDAQLLATHTNHDNNSWTSPHDHSTATPGDAAVSPPAAPDVSTTPPTESGLSDAQAARDTAPYPSNPMQVSSYPEKVSSNPEQVSDRSEQKPSKEQVIQAMIRDIARIELYHIGEDAVYYVTLPNPDLALETALWLRSNKEWKSQPVRCGIKTEAEFQPLCDRPLPQYGLCSPVPPPPLAPPPPPPPPPRRFPQHQPRQQRLPGGRGRGRGGRGGRRPRDPRATMPQNDLDLILDFPPIGEAAKATVIPPVANSTNVGYSKPYRRYSPQALREIYRHVTRQS